MSVKRIWHGWTTHEKSYVPHPAQKLLKRWDQHSAHYTTIEKRNYRL